MKTSRVSVGRCRGNQPAVQSLGARRNGASSLWKHPGHGIRSFGSGCERSQRSPSPAKPRTSPSADTTNESGNYSVTHLIPDVYSIRIEGTGFKTLQYKDIQVSADTGSRVDGQFQVGSASEQVEVTAEAPQLKTDRADVAIEFDQRAIENAPILNRNFTSFELLSPGTQKLVGWSHAATENPQGGQQIFVNGQHFSGTAFELDGTDNQDPILGIIVVNPNLDAIQEAKVTLGNYDAEFGKAVAGVVTVQTKSGSNDIHGSGFWFRRTDALAARDPFTQFKPDPVTGPADSLLPLAAVRRDHRRSDHQEQAVLLRRLPGHASEEWHQQPGVDSDRAAEAAPA